MFYSLNTLIFKQKNKPIHNENRLISDLLALYTLTGGVAKYVELFIDKKKFTEKKMMDMFFERDSNFLPEGSINFIVIHITVTAVTITQKYK